MEFAAEGERPPQGLGLGGVGPRCERPGLGLGRWGGHAQLRSGEPPNGIRGWG
jgi:hypothetical protein